MGRERIQRVHWPCTEENDRQGSKQGKQDLGYAIFKGSWEGWKERVQLTLVERLLT